MAQRPKRLLILFSDTGGGHRSSACAVAQALQDMYAGQVQVELLDGLDYAPWPFCQLDDLYPYMVRLRGWPWAIGYRLSNGPRRAAWLTGTFWPWTRSSVLRLLRDHPADAILCCHPAFNHVLLRGLKLAGLNTPLITLVTDLATAHALWLAPHVDHCLVPTPGGRQCALSCGLPQPRIVVTGLPVSMRFTTTAQEDPVAVRQRLGLPTDRPVVLLVSGAEGMGPVQRLCQQITSSGVSAQLVVIAGRNERLQAHLSTAVWPIPVRVEGFVNNMHEWMRAADLLISKAGPSTVSEALVMGLPMVLSDALPGQEHPNVDYVVRSGAGVWAPTPRQAARTVGRLIADPQQLAAMAARARALARPNAARRVAEIIWEMACRPSSGVQVPELAHPV